jgi:hypothetical protein
MIGAAYNPAAWYWIVAGGTAQIWSSAALAYVPSSDPGYQAWLAQGNLPSRIGSTGELLQVTLAQVVPNIFAQGVAVQSSGTPSLNAIYAIIPSALDALTSLSTGIAAGKPLPGGGSTFNYPDATGSPHALTSTNLLNLAAAIESYVYNYQQSLGALLVGTAASLPTQPLAIP